MNYSRYFNKSNGFEFVDLDSRNVRNYMVNEIKLDISLNRLYISKRLNITGKNIYPDLLIEAASSLTEVELTNRISVFFNKTELTKNLIEKKVPKNAARIFAEGEFNRFYIRAVCLESVSQGNESVEIYRGRQSSFARPESELKIDKHLNANDLLEDLRTNIGKPPRILPEINSGLTIKLIGVKTLKEIVI